MAEEEEKKKPAEGGDKKGGADKKGAPGEASGKPVLMGMIGAIVVLQVIVAFVVITVTKPKPPKEKAETEQAAQSGHGEKTAKAEGHGEAKAEGHGEAKEGGAEIEGMHITEKPCEVVINIAGTENKGYLKVAVAFAFHAANKKFAEEMPKIFFPVFKHYMIEILSPMTLEELSQPEAKEKVRKELLRKVQEVVPKAEASMEDVFIIDYLIQ